MKLLAIPALASALALAACGAPAEEQDMMTEADTTANATAASTNTVVDVASGNEDFSTLVAAVDAAGLAETLAGDGPFTVFAPNNAAFDKLPEGTVEDLVKPENQAKLSGILTYHVVAGETMAAGLSEAIRAGEGSAELGTVNGGKFTATVEGDDVIVTDAAGNSAKVTATDIDASNGVIHVIDTVLMPE